MSATCGRRPGSAISSRSPQAMSAAARTGANKVPFLRTSNVFWDRLDLVAGRDVHLRGRTRGEEPPAWRPARLRGWRDRACRHLGRKHRAHLLPEPPAPAASQARERPCRPAVFYVFFLQSAFTQLGIFEGAGNKTTIPNLSSNRLAALEVPIPATGAADGCPGARARPGGDRPASESLATAEALRHRVMATCSPGDCAARAEPRESEIGDMPEAWDAARFATSVRICATARRRAAP